MVTENEEARDLCDKLLERNKVLAEKNKWLQEVSHENPSFVESGGCQRTFGSDSVVYLDSDGDTTWVSVVPLGSERAIKVSTTKIPAVSDDGGSSRHVLESAAQGTQGTVAVDKGNVKKDAAPHEATGAKGTQGTGAASSSDRPASAAEGAQGTVAGSSGRGKSARSPSMSKDKEGDFYSMKEEDDDEGKGDAWESKDKRKLDLNALDDPDSSSSSSSSDPSDHPSDDSDARRRRRKKKKNKKKKEQNDSKKELRELPKIDVPEYPTVATLGRYRSTLHERVLACAQDKDEPDVVNWIRAVEKEGAKTEDFANSGKGFETLDRKMCVALVGTVKGEMVRTLELLKNKMMEEHGQILRGRQVLREIYKQLATSANTRNMFSMKEIMELKWFGDDKMESFRNTWDQRTTEAMGFVPPWVLCEQFRGCLRASKELGQAMIMFDERHIGEAANDAEAEAWYQELRSILDRYIDKKRNQANHETRLLASQRQVQQQMSGTAANRSAAAPAPQASQGSGGRKERAKAKVKVKASRQAKEKLPVKDRGKEPDPPLQEKGVVKVKRV